MVKCQVCGEEIGDAKFCNNCGSKIEETIVEEEKEKIFCSNCGKELDADMEFCNECGTSVNGSVPAKPIQTNRQNNNTQSAGVTATSEKNPILALILSFFIPGLGQFYLGLNKKGIIFLIAWIVSDILLLFYIGILLYLIIWGYGLYDAYTSAEKLNKGEFVEDNIDFNNLF